MGWNNNDEIFLMRYPIMVHKDPVNLKFDFTQVRFIKTNISVKILIGQDGNLWFGFVNKDINTNFKLATIEYNRLKYYGWYMDFESYPYIAQTDSLTLVGINPYYINPII